MWNWSIWNQVIRSGSVDRRPSVWSRRLFWPKLTPLGILSLREFSGILSWNAGRWVMAGRVKLLHGMFATKKVSNQTSSKLHRHRKIQKWVRKELTSSDFREGRRLLWVIYAARKKHIKQIWSGLMWQNYQAASAADPCQRRLGGITIPVKIWET